MRFIDNIKKLFGREWNQKTDSLTASPRVVGSGSCLPPPYRSNALNVAAAYRCVTLLSESVANLPLQFMRLKNNIYVPDTNSRLHYLLNVQPNAAYSAYDFWVQAVQRVLLYGNAYIVPIYDPATVDLDRLILCSPGSVAHNVSDDTYTVLDTLNGVRGTYPEDQIIHLKGFSYDGKRGVSVLTHARLSMSIASTGDRETLNRFANGGNVRGIVSNDNSVRGFGEYADNQLEKTAQTLDEKFQSGERIVSLPGQVRFNSLSLSSTDMQFLESRKFSVREICRFFGVHPSFVFDDTSNNYKSAEMANVAFLSNTLNPLLRRIENELLRKLVAPTLAGKRKIQFDRRSLYACDLDSKVKYQSQSLAIGIYTVNELRAEENKPPVKGGDLPLVSANLKGLGELTATQSPEIEPNVEPNKIEDDE
jgi:HK97 family phage portal protein